jgi:hypothetical protein
VCSPGLAWPTLTVDWAGLAWPDWVGLAWLAGLDCLTWAGPA